jgi:hypothetical protein
MSETPFRHTDRMVVMEIDRAPEGPEAKWRGRIAEVGRTPWVDDAHGGIPPRPSTSHEWHPLAGPALLERLRVTGRPRLKADPELARRLRSSLEHGLLEPEGAGGATGTSDVGTSTPTPPPVVVTKDRLTSVLACEAHHVAREFGDRPPTAAMACGALIDVLFRQLITVGTIDDPMADGLAALGIDDHQQELASWIERLPAAEREALRIEVERQTNGLLRHWPTLAPGWLPRTQETMRVGLARGAIELSARVDLAIGRPAEDEASVALVEIKAGARRVEHRADLHFYALVEALRAPAPPFVVATYYTRTGELDVDPVTDELLVGAVRRTIAGTRSLWNLAHGAKPRRTPNSLCGRCVVLPDCDVGQTRVELSGVDEARGPRDLR